MVGNKSVPHDWYVKNCIAKLTKDIGLMFDEPLFVDDDQFVCAKFDSDTDEYVASQIWQKQMQYEESDRYVSMRGLRYGL